ncbi:unnamed protein product [Adineta steineri]|uniref:Uncharacterized protein n=1 Tax=Adineta steineri TaxID=433720 RepID=A0A814EF76_9BILA|nr:unnamed protein product [Adineta steineri]CAF1092112.1 unnamed protein product [Adineta steineri]
MHLVRMKKQRQHGQYGSPPLSDQADTALVSTPHSHNSPRQEQRFNSSIWQLLPFIGAINIFDLFVKFNPYSYKDLIRTIPSGIDI